MPDLATRTKHESQLTAAIAAVLATHRDARDWPRLERDLTTNLESGLRLVFVDAANELYAEQGLTTDPARLMNIAAEWSERYAPTLASEVASNLRTGTDDAIERTRAAAGEATEQEIQRNVINALLTLFGEERAANIAITETTRAITGGELTAAGSIRGTSSGRYVAVDRAGEVIGGQPIPGQKQADQKPTDQPPGETIGKRLSITAHWNTERDSLVCPVCRPLHGKPQGEWGVFANGPPAHPRCRCWLNWRVPVSEN